MCSSWRLLATLVVMTGLAPALAPPGPGEDELAANRRLLDKYRADPEHYSRLKRDWRAFQALPAGKQDRMRRLDHDLREEDSATQARLERVLERYASWLERLPEADSRRVAAAGDANERLQVIQEIREREWLARLPRAVREQVRQTPAEKRAALVVELRDKDRKQRQDWQQAVQHRVPARLDRFPAEVQAFVNVSLSPLLSDEEKQRLKTAEGKWFFGATLVELADRHPMVVPPSPVAWPRNYPEAKQQQLGQRIARNSLDKARLQSVEGKWPDFALYIADVARSRNVTIPPLGPSRPKDFTAAVQRFIDKELLPRLNDEDRERLRKAEGHWPDYPKTLVELARKHNLQVPGMALPGPREFWDSLRSELPEVPDRVLRDFALTQLTREDHKDLQLSYSDPLSRDRLKRKFFEVNPEELQRLRTFDIQRPVRQVKKGF